MQQTIVRLNKNTEQQWVYCLSVLTTNWMYMYVVDFGLLDKKTTSKISLCLFLAFNFTFSFCLNTVNKLNVLCVAGRPMLENALRAFLQNVYNVTGKS